MAQKQPSMILVIDDEKNIREALRQGLTMEGFDVMASEDGEDGLKKFQTIGADAVVLDLKMPKLNGMEFLKRAHAIDPDIPILILTGHGGVDDAVEAMRQGAYDFFTKDTPLDKLIITLTRAIEEHRRKHREEQLMDMIDDRFKYDNIIGNSPPVRDVLKIVGQVAPTNASVLITGESGTGKELIAGAIHSNSNRKNGPFIKVHCAALTETLLESELFGHEKGAFTGAIARKRGRFELADGGTIFLDEIGEISQAVQVKLLRVLQEHSFERVGGEDTLDVDIRIIAATNKDLKQEVENGNFRQDLYFRLNVVHIDIPPLRIRTGDISLLSNYFLKVFTERHGKKVDTISNKAMKLLENYDWPGNIRELQNVIENAVVLSTAPVIEPENLPTYIRNYQGTTHLQIEIGMSMAEIERHAVLATLDSVGWNKSEAARVLKIGRKTLLRKLDEYGIHQRSDLGE